MDQFEFANRISYFLWSMPPDEHLTILAKDNKLYDEKVLKNEIDRMLKDAKSENFIKGFARRFMGSIELDSHQVDADKFPDWKKSLNQEWQKEADDLFRFLLMSDRSYLDMFTIPLADVPSIKKSSTSNTLNSSDRRGILGLRSLLTITSGSYATSPTKRALFILERFICQPIPAPEVIETFNDTLGEERVKHLTARDKLKKHREDPSCAVCHDIMDPIGVALEKYDAIGGYRKEYINGAKIDVQTKTKLGIEINGIEGVSSWIKSNEQTTYCFVKQMHQYALGRRSTPHDLQHIRQISKQWGSGSIKDLILTIFLSDSFRNARGR